MARDELSLREAGDLINSGGHDRDVKRADERSLTNRQRRREEADDGYDDRDDEGYDEFDGDDADDDEADDSSNRNKRGDTDDDEADDDGNEADDGETDDDDESGEGEDDASRADPMDAEYEVKVNGKSEKVTLKDLLSAYPKAGDYYQKTQALATRRRELDAGHTTVAKQYHDKLNAVNGLYGKVRDLLVGDINSQAMQQLRHENPQEWLVQRQAMQDRVDAVNRVLQGIHQEQEQHRNEFTGRQKQELANTVALELEALERHIPDWKTEGKVRLAKYLVEGMGFSQKEIGEVVDSRMLLVAEKARLYDKIMEERNGTSEKRTRKKPPRNAKPKGGQMRRQPTQQRKANTQFRDAKNRAKKTGDMRDAGRAIGHLLR